MNGQRQPRARVMFILDFFGRRLDEHGRWSQSGHKTVATLTS